MIIKRGKKHQLMNSAIVQHLLTDAKPSFLNPNPGTSFQVTPSCLYTRHDILWCGLFLWSVQVPDVLLLSLVGFFWFVCLFVCFLHSEHETRKNSP